MQPEIYQQVEKELQALTIKFIEEAGHLEKILNKNPSIQVNTISVSARFHPKIMASNKPCLLLVEFIKVYDNLITLIKLIHLTACFDSDNAYYANLNRVQKMGNNMLSQILLLQKQKTL